MKDFSCSERQPYNLNNDQLKSSIQTRKQAQFYPMIDVVEEEEDIRLSRVFIIRARPVIFSMIYIDRYLQVVSILFGGD